MGKNRTPTNLCSKLSLIHTIDASQKYFKCALTVSFYLDFLRFDFAIYPAGFAKSDNYPDTSEVHRSGSYQLRREGVKFDEGSQRVSQVSHSGRIHSPPIILSLFPPFFFLSFLSLFLNQFSLQRQVNFFSLKVCTYIFYFNLKRYKSIIQKH